MTRGWTSQDLPVVEDETYWTVADAAHYMGPLPGDDPRLPIAATMTKLRILSRFHLTPIGKRRTTPPGHPGRYARVYAADDFIKLYEQMGNTHRSAA
jgi:hypothetical protein